MRRPFVFLFVFAMLFAVVRMFAQGGVPERAPAYATATDIPYTSTTILKFPTGVYMGEGIGVATNSKGHIFLYTRGGDNSHLMEFDALGRYLREIGPTYAQTMAHAVRVDAHDNIWIVDEGTDMVVEFNPQGKVIMTLGRRPEQLGFTPNGTPPVLNQPYVFGRPTDIAWDTQGNIFLSDGYNNSRVIKYDPDGRYLASSGVRGSGPDGFNTPHGIAVDAKGNVYVADRGNRRIKVFDNDLKQKAIYDNIGAPWAICITPGPHQYLYASNSWPDSNDSRQAAVSGEIYKMELDGTVVGKFGKAGKQLGEFSSVHAMDCHSENELLVGEITAWRVQKINLHPQAQQVSQAKR